jgi:predicted nucleic acid-binding protein
LTVAWGVVMTVGPFVVVADASFLINFINLDRIDLIARHHSRFLVTDHVNEEIIFQSQKIILQAALNADILQICSVSDFDDLEVFYRLCQNLGSGESSAIAFASRHGYALAMDDGKAIRFARRLSPPLQVIRTQDLLLSMIQEGLLDISEADRLKNELATRHKFNMGIRSFGDLI